MKPIVVKIAIAGATVSGFVLPFEGIGSLAFSQYLGVRPFDLCALVFAPVFLAAAHPWRRRLLSNLLGIFLLVWLLSFLPAAIFSVDPLLEWKPFLRCAIAVTVIGGISAIEQDRASYNMIQFGFLVGGLISLVVSLVGFALQLMSASREAGVQSFVFVGPVPGAGTLMRLTGTFGSSPVHYGEMLVGLIAVSYALSMRDFRASILRWVLLAVRLLAPIALLLTQSFAVAGGVVLGAALIRRRYARSTLATVGLFSVAISTVAALSFLMNIGLPSPQSASDSDVQILKSLDQEHTFVVTKENSDEFFPERIKIPYSGWITVYLHAKKTAAALAVEHFPFGTGYAQYPGYVKEKIERDYRAAWSNSYGYPHCQYLTSVATAGLFGLIAVAVFVSAAIQIFRNKAVLGTAEGWAAAWCLAAFCVLGINLDIFESRPLWWILALMLGRLIRGPWTKGKQSSSIV